MGELRKKWGAYKDRSVDEFKQLHAKELLSVDLKGVTGYPVKFDKDLGPTLDKLEAAVKAKKAGDVATLKLKAQGVIKEYRTRIDNNKKVLGDKPAATLKSGLDFLDGKI